MKQSKIRKMRNLAWTNSLSRVPESCKVLREVISQIIYKKNEGDSKILR